MRPLRGGSRAIAEGAAESLCGPRSGRASTSAGNSGYASTIRPMPIKIRPAVAKHALGHVAAAHSCRYV